ncbi:MAG: UDP-galactopyranose mutase [Hyphomicrobiales bacterium]
MTEYDFVIVGSGLFGAICAHELKRAGRRVVVLERRRHVGGNVYTEVRDGITLHAYGPHIFHTDDDEVWNWINRFATFNDFRLQAVATYQGEVYSLPFSMWTFSRIYGVTTPEEAKTVIARQSAHIGEPRNLEEQAIKLVGVDVYEKLIRGYTEKQWRKPCRELPPSIVRRLPVRFTYDNNYYRHRHQGVAVGGYTQIVEKLLAGVPVITGCDYLDSRAHWDARGRVIFTGPIDRLFDYAHGELEYKTTEFVHTFHDVENVQGTAMMNYTDAAVPFTRVVEHKHFEFGVDPGSWITHEYPAEYRARFSEPYYPVNDAANTARYRRYRDEADAKGMLVGGRLGEYKYYDMDQVIRSALDFARALLTG